jgi:transcriptional regulator with XRE-family HTH domain
MIRNDAQLAVSRRKRSEAMEAATEATSFERDAYLEFARDIEREIREYLDVRDGRRRSFSIASFDDLPAALVKARIARHMTQRALAESLDVAPQMVQRDEAGGYERATATRLADVIDAVGYELVGVLAPRELGWSGAIEESITLSNSVLATRQVMDPEEDVMVASTSRGARMARRIA